MGLWSQLTSYSEWDRQLAGGLLPGGYSPRDVAVNYVAGIPDRAAAREDFYADILPGAGGGETSLASFAEGLDRILTGRVGAYNASQGQWNPSWGDAGRQTAGVFLPDYVYRPPEVTGAKGSDGSGNWFPQGLVPDSWEEPGQKLLILAALVAAVALAK